jgi:non-ribosomal peptide synthase protein (TIGR01720 family)
VMALREWSGLDRVQIGLEGHGRVMEGPFASCDLSRTVGWFTTAFPLLFSAVGTANLGDLISSVKEHLRSVPSQGIRYLSSVQRGFPSVLFNYLGQLGSSFSDSSFFQEATEGVGQFSSGSNAPFSEISVDSVIERGRLAISVSMVASKYHHETAAALCAGLAQSVRYLVSHCVSRSIVTYSPSDFPLAKLEFGVLSSVVAGIRQACGSAVELEDLFPINPLQAGILYHSLLHGANDPYLNQIVWRIDSSLSTEQLVAGIEVLFLSEPVLRSAFVTENVDQPLQYVLKPQFARATIHAIALETVPLERFLSQDLFAGIVLHKAPLCRATILSDSSSQKYVVLTTHHSLIDGWSVPLLQSRLEKICLNYNATGRWNHLTTPQIGAYAAWLNKQDRMAQLGYWKSDLSGAEPLHVSALLPQYAELTQFTFAIPDLNPLLQNKQ